LIDKDDIPLVIDQPEENLDNQTIYEVLVKCLADVKKRRQVIVVTHNPNLAVVCDAEQVIHASLDKTTSSVKYSTGAIENPEMNKHAINVLEGTRPAFNNRDSKYFV
jgi:ABC-type lipoprotein export system ATPase subunit